MELMKHAYIRRKRWEFREQAIAIAQLFGGGTNTSKGSYTAGYKEVSTDEMLSRIGMN
jgi:hypothetical protein